MVGKKFKIIYLSVFTIILSVLNIITILWFINAVTKAYIINISMSSTQLGILSFSFFAIICLSAALALIGMAIADVLEDVI
jgi:hypothetical protein